MTIAERRAAGVTTTKLLSHLTSNQPSAAYGSSVSRQYGPSTGYTHTNAFALTSMILGILGGSVLAIIFGHLAKAQIRRTGEKGEGMATAGLVLGYLGTAIVAIIILSSWIAMASMNGS